MHRLDLKIDLLILELSNAIPMYVVRTGVIPEDLVGIHEYVGLLNRIDGLRKGDCQDARACQQDWKPIGPAEALVVEYPIVVELLLVFKGDIDH